MMGGELAAARITDPRLRQAYGLCRRLNAAHGRTFFLTTRLLAPCQRPGIHALYGFARLADDIVDEPGSAPEARLTELSQRLKAGLECGHSTDPVMAAVIDTATRYRLAPQLFASFLASMRMDLTVSDYPTRAELDRYVHGSAEVIGVQVLPILGTVGDPAEAAPYAAALGKAFQLTNFLRDIAEDLDRGRVYMPADELAAYGVNRDLLTWCRERGCLDSRVRAALAAQHEHARKVYRFATTGIELLHPVSRSCVTTALVLYSEILDRIEANDYQVFRRRVTVPQSRRMQVAGPALARAIWARRGGRAHPLASAAEASVR